MKPRAELIFLLGASCNHCGFIDIRALQIDHRFGGGLRMIRERFNNRSEAMYSYYLKHFDEAERDLQVLCANCNMIKARLE